jgi:hypothetical protein
MKTFVSHSRAQAGDADALALALRSAGHEAVLDRDLLKGGDEFNARLRAELQGCDLFVFMISPDSVRKGCFALTEVEWARERWPGPAGNVLPVMWLPTPMEDVPQYLRTPTILFPVGNAVAETVAAVSDIAAERAARQAVLDARRRRWWVGGGGVLVLGVGLAAALWPRGPGPLALCLVDVHVKASPAPVTTVDAGAAGAAASHSVIGGNGIAVVEIAGLTDAETRWTIDLADANGRSAARFELKGCPRKPQELEDGHGSRIVVGPHT